MAKTEFVKKVLLVFVSAFFLNLIWENAHSILYLNYKGGEITEFILIWASLSDAIYIMLASILMLVLKNRKVGVLVACFALLLLSFFIEKWALSSGRWAYDTAMPIVPIIDIGLTPAIQLALLGFTSFKIAKIY